MKVTKLTVSTGRAQVYFVRVLATSGHSAYIVKMWRPLDVNGTHGTQDNLGTVSGASGRWSATDMSGTVSPRLVNLDAVAHWLAAQFDAASEPAPAAPVDRTELPDHCQNCGAWLSAVEQTGGSRTCNECLSTPREDDALPEPAPAQTTTYKVFFEDEGDDVFSREFASDGEAENWAEYLQARGRDAFVRASAASTPAPAQAPVRVSTWQDVEGAWRVDVNGVRQGPGYSRHEYAIAAALAICPNCGQEKSTDAAMCLACVIRAEQYVCHCGNTSCSSGFHPCDGAGVEMEPTPAWPGYYACGSCGSISA